MNNYFVYTGLLLLGLFFAVADLEVDGFTKLGVDAPAIQMKRLNGTMPL